MADIKDDIKNDIKSAIQALAESGKIDPISVMELLKTIDDGGFSFDNKGRLIGILDPHNDLTIIADHHDLFREAANILAKKHEVELTDVMLGRGRDKPLKIDDFIKNNDYLLGDALHDGMFRDENSEFPAMEIPNEPTESEFASSGDAVASLLGTNKSKNDELAKDPDMAPLDKFLEPSSETEFGAAKKTLLEDPKETPKPDEPTSSQNQSYDSGGGSLLNLITGAGRLAGQPFKFGNNLIKSNVNSLSDWRKNRPAQKLSEVITAERKLIDNLTKFRNGQFKDFEAAVLKNDGWTPDISMKFEDALHTDPDFMNDWKLTTSGMREYEKLTKSAMKLNDAEDKADAAYDEISASIDRVGQAGGPVPAEMDKGNVKSTFEEKSGMLKEFIQRLIKKLLDRVFGVADTATNSGGAARPHMSP